MGWQWDCGANLPYAESDHPSSFQTLDEAQQFLGSLSTGAPADTSPDHLWCEVIARAWGDCFDAADPDAERFLLDAEGEWAQSRENVCAAAGLDPDELRAVAERERART